MTNRYSQISPLALSVGFGAAALAGVALFMVPFGFSMLGMRGYGMMAGAGDGYAMGFGSSLLVGFCVIITSAVAGAVAATVYNSLLPQHITLDDKTAAIKPT